MIKSEKTFTYIWQIKRQRNSAWTMIFDRHIAIYFLDAVAHFNYRLYRPAKNLILSFQHQLRVEGFPFDFRNLKSFVPNWTYLVIDL